jgi:hypothetical protein
MMPGIIRKIKNWLDFQHYQTGKNAKCRPEWIKLYHKLLDDIEWHELDPVAAKTLVSLWLLASENGGTLPPLKTIAFRLRMPEKQIQSVLCKLPHWIEDDPRNVLGQSYDNPRPDIEEEIEEEIERELEGAIAPDQILTPLNAVLKEATSAEIVGYRKRLKQPLTPLSAQRLAAALAKWPNPEDAAAEMMLRGWRGFKPEWMQDRGQGPPAKEKHFRGVVQEFLDEVDEKHGNGRRAICGKGGVGNIIELHAATPRLENHAGIADAGSSGASEIDAVEHGRSTNGRGEQE